MDFSRRMSFFVFCVIFLIKANPCFGETNERQDYYLEPVVVYPSILNEYYSNSLRHIEYREDIQVPIDQDLKKVSFADIQTRGPLSVQSDLQMRGASFEQTDVLIDGIKVNDPQTGHFNLDIPFSTDDIDKIILIPGPAAVINGAGRPGGAVHIITKQPQGKSIKAKVVLGDNNFLAQQLSVEHPVARINTRTSISESSSDGYRENTDFDLMNFSHISCWESGYGDVQFNLGVLDKEFGANGFYSEFFPNQQEHTKTTFGSIGIKSEYDDFYINPQIYVRRQSDRFLLNKDNPAFYENNHLNYVKGVKVDTVNVWAQGKVFAGIDAALESIDSSNLKQHDRQRNMVYTAYSTKLDQWLLSFGLSGYFYQGFENQAAPDISIGYYFNDSLKVRSAFSQSFRAPTFTELYYQSPSNIGNENLFPERSNNYEIGIDCLKPDYLVSLTYFKQEGKELIDWVRAPAATVYNIMNINRVDTKGVQADLRIYPKDIDMSLKRWQEIYLGYAFVGREQKENGLISKYVFDYLEHKFVGGVINLLPYGISLDSSIIYQQRSDAGGDFIVNSKFDKTINKYKVFVKVDNIFNHGYAEKGNIPMPGRWFFAGVEAQW
ncbi:MAG: TonB-dependent receptor [Candidatus Omnitrophica bacterium]|nr:TonB-dependent receptor [Candidatus Omnitrophota bacterium]